MQIEHSAFENMPIINTTDGKPVDFKTELKKQISFFQSNQGFINRKTAGIFLSQQIHTDTIEHIYSETVKCCGSDWSLLKFTGATNRAGLPEVTRSFRLKTLIDASYYSGIIKGTMVHFFLTLFVTTLLVVSAIFSLSFIPLLKRWIIFPIAHPWLLATSISMYILFISCKTSSIINSRKKSTLQAFNNAISKADPAVIGKLHHFYSNQILGSIQRPLAVLVNDFGTLDKFTKDVLYKVLTSSEEDNYSGGLLVCIGGDFQCEFFEKMKNDQEFRVLGGNYTFFEMS